MKKKLNFNKVKCSSLLSPNLDSVLGQYLHSICDGLSVKFLDGHILRGKWVRRFLWEIICLPDHPWGNLVEP